MIAPEQLTKKVMNEHSLTNFKPKTLPTQIIPSYLEALPYSRFEQVESVKSLDHLANSGRGTRGRSMNRPRSPRCTQVVGVETKVPRGLGT